MDQSWSYISLAVVVVQAIATAVIAFFAMATWRATKTVARATDTVASATEQYARMAGLSLFELAVRQYGGGERAGEPIYVGLVRSFRRQFPDEWKQFEYDVDGNLRVKSDPQGT